MEPKQQEALRQSYLETRYSIFLSENQKPIDIYIGKPLPEDINEQLRNINYGAVILTAWNPMSESQALDINKKRNHKLKEKLLSLGCVVFSASGEAIDMNWLAEESFFVLLTEECCIQDLAVEFGQYAYILLELDKAVELVFTPLWFR